MDTEAAPPGPRRGLLSHTARAVSFATVAAFIALLAYGLATQAPDATIDDALARAEAVDAPAFELQTLDPGRPPANLRQVVDAANADGRVALAELRGTPLVLNFWASWCDPCRTEAPVIERAWRQAGRDGVLFVGIDVQDVTDDGRAFLRAFRISYLNIRDRGNDVARKYGATGMPETYFISARGQVVNHVVGAIDAQQMQRGIDAARSGRPLSAARGGEIRPTR